jgi:hypothetical protein
MDTMDKLDNAWEAARLALLERIEKDTKENASAEAMLQLAEAYAWLTSVAQPH